MITRDQVILVDGIEGARTGSQTLSHDYQTQKLLPTLGLNSQTDDYDPCMIVVKPAE